MGKKRYTSYPLDLPLSSRIAKMIDESRAKLYRGDVTGLEHFYHQGRAEVLESLYDEIEELENNYAIDRDNAAWESSHSGYGRGDSMG